MPAGDGRNLACFSIWGTCADRRRAPLPWRSRDLLSGLLILIGCRAPWAASSGGLCPPTVPTVAPTLVLVCSRRRETCTRAWVTRTTEVHCLPVLGDRNPKPGYRQGCVPGPSASLLQLAGNLGRPWAHGSIILIPVLICPWRALCVRVCVQMSPLNKDTSHPGLGPSLLQGDLNLTNSV